MRGPIVLLLTLVAAIGGWMFFQELPVGGLGRRQGSDASESDKRSTLAATGAPLKRPGDSIHLASFNIQMFGRTKASKPHVMDMLASIARQFDVIAVQQVRALDQDVIPRLVDHINAGGRSYDYVIGPRVGRGNTIEQFAFLFDRSTVVVDRNQLYTVQDPDDLLNWDPLVGWFRAVGPPDDEAFTFTLVNVHIDPDDMEKELRVLDDMFRAVRDDGRGEDDVIVLGNFNTDARRLGPLAQDSGIAWATTGVPTDTRGTAQYDNLVFRRAATDEFTGRAGVFDFMRQFNLTMDEALEISDHLPVWAEFTVYEGGQPGRVADGGRRAPK